MLAVMEDTRSREVREWLDEQKKGYVLAVACNATVGTQAGPKRAGELTALVPADAWQRISCADGSACHRSLAA